MRANWIQEDIFLDAEDDFSGHRAAGRANGALWDDQENQHKNHQVVNMFRSKNKDFEVTARSSGLEVVGR